MSIFYQKTVFRQQYSRIFASKSSKRSTLLVAHTPELNLQKVQANYSRENAERRFMKNLIDREKTLPIVKIRLYENKDAVENILYTGGYFAIHAHRPGAANSASGCQPRFG
ncbi:MAG TPA: hypothetical protein VF556_13840 [Pyrinomonadaceae bacterium]|jgi:hypothetical protein